ncbi:MAG: radical SAM protein [Planctomycetes bacterium]|nr:radical SAM protein [Planctomycetota bacterium]
MDGDSLQNATHLQARLGAGDLAVETADLRALRVDAEGRWRSFRPAGPLRRRTLDGNIVVSEAGVRRALDPDEIAATHTAVAAFAADLAGGIERDAFDLELRGPDADRAELVARLDAAAQWTPDRFRQDAERFTAAYPEPVLILPPDRYQDLVVLPALGCPHGRCKFCAFYRERGFHILGRAEFEAHLEAVCRFFGRAGRTRDGIFLGSASALSLPDARLLAVLEAVRRTFGVPRRGVAAFHDPDHSPVRSGADYAALREAGLTAVTLGLETGSPALRKQLGKRPDLDRVLAALAGAKEAGLRCGITILVGAGGPQAAAAHRTATAEVLHRMPLEPGDLVYLSPYTAAMSRADTDREFARLRAALAPATRARIVPYRIERFAYFA